MGRFSNVPTVQTRVGLVSDNLIEVGAVCPTTFNRFRFMDITKSKNTSARDKLRDLVFYGFITQNNNVIHDNLALWYLSFSVLPSIA